MRAVLVVIANVVEEKSLQLPFVHSNDMIQQLPPLSIQRSATPFCHGLSNEVWIASIPRDRTAAGTSTPYFLSRSNIRNRGAEPNGNASRNCCTTHRLVGCFVTLRCRTRLRS